MYNKIVYGDKILIDLTGDTVAEEKLLKGVKAHKADGSVVTGTLFSDYPKEYHFADAIQDSEGGIIMDVSAATLMSNTIYQRI